MTGPYDTALLRTAADRLPLPTEAERRWAEEVRATRPTLRDFLAEVFALAPRHGTVSRLLTGPGAQRGRAPRRA